MSRVPPWIIVAILIASLGNAWLAFREHLPPWLGGPATPVAAPHDHSHGSAQRVKLSPQAQENLKLTSQPLVAENYWRKTMIPGTIIERPGHTDQALSAPSPGVIAKVFVVPGDIVQPGQSLFMIRLLGEGVVTAQNELFKNGNELEIAKIQLARIEPLAKEGIVARSRLTEIQNQIQRLNLSAEAYRQDLRNRGISSAQIDGIVAGKFVTEIEVNAPQKNGAPKDPSAANHDPGNFEIQELNVELGQQIQAGQPLCLLGRHATLDIEGRVFRDEASLVERALKQAWPVEIEFLDDASGDWPPLPQDSVIRSVASTIDPAQKTLAFYLSLNNQSRPYEKDGVRRQEWRFRPGQRVRLNLRTELLKDVFVLPAEAVTHEGPEAYVFRQNGSTFERLSVRVLHEDRRHAVLAPGETLAPGWYIAQTAAAQLNRALKSQEGSGHAGVHMHADGTIHAPGQ